MKESPMRAMFLIASKGRPEFKSWNTISARFSFQLTIVLLLQIFFSIVHLFHFFQIPHFSRSSFDVWSRPTRNSWRIAQRPVHNKVRQYVEKQGYHDVLYFSLRPLVRQRQKTLIFLWIYFLTRITCFSALAWVTCCRILYKSKRCKVKFHFHLVKLKVKFGTIRSLQRAEMWGRIGIFFAPNGAKQG